MCTIKKRKFWAEFISIYRKHEALWYMGSEKYKSQRLKEIGYGALVEKYHEIEPDAVLQDVKTRINTMRTCYKKELNKVLRSEASGGEDESIYVPTLWYFNELNFLRNHCSMKERKNYEPVFLDETETVEITSRHKNNKNKNTESLSHANTLSVKKRKSSYEEIDEGSDITHPQTIDDDPDYADDFAEDFIEVPAKKRQKRDDAEIFSESWAVLFRKCSPEQQIYAKRAIEEILLLGQLDRLSFNSHRFQI